MKPLKRTIALLLIVALLPTFSVVASNEITDVASGKSLEYSDGSYILDLGRSYPVEDVQISGTDTSSAEVVMSNDTEFSQGQLSRATNIAIDKPILSKLYGEGGFTSEYAVRYAVDGNSSTQFISTPSKTSIEWLTIDLENPALISNVKLDFTANRTYTVAVTNTPYANGEEFTDGIELIELNGTKTFVMPDEYKNDSFRYVRLRFAGDAPSNYYRDVNMYVSEFEVNGVFSEDESTNIAIDKPILSKLYGEGGFTSEYAVKYAVDGNSSTQFISTPVKDSIEWLTIDLEHPAMIKNVKLNFTANRTYTVAVTNTLHANGEEFTDGIELIELNGTKTFVMPDEYKYDSFRYVRLRFEGDAPSDYYLDVNMYVYEFEVNGTFTTYFETPDLTTTTLIKNDAVFTLNNAARDNYYRYLKVSGVSEQPTIRVNTKSELVDFINIAPDADITIADDASIYGDYSLDKVNDNNYSTFTAFNYDNPYVQLDLHEKQAISHVEVYGSQDMPSDCDDMRILLSNSPDFDNYIILGEKLSSESIGSGAAFVKSKNNIFDCYRYVRVYGGSSEGFLALSEIKVFAREGFEELYNVAQNVLPTADTNEKIAYRATDKDIKSYWSGNTLTISLDRCYSVNALNVTAIGSIKLTYGCDNGTKVSYTGNFEKIETKNFIFDGNVSTVKIEKTDSNAVKVYDVGVYAKRKNMYISSIEPESVTTLASGYDIIDLGRIVVIDHIEPCNISVDVSEMEDFTKFDTITGCQSAMVSARYIRVSSDEDVDVIGYESPKLVSTKDGKNVEFNAEAYGNRENTTAIATSYQNDKTIETVTFGNVSDGSLSLEASDKVSFLVWDGIISMKPLLPKSETVYVNKIPQAEFYVDPNVSVSGDGTKNSPFKTISAAKNAVRAINRSMTGDIVVNLKGGRYNLDSALTFSYLDGATNGYKIIYQNVEGETPVITGGKAITGFREGSNGIWYAKASGFDSIYELIVNGEVATIAKTETPIHAEAFYSNGTSYAYDGISFGKDQLPMFSNPDDVFVHVTRSWMDNILKVTSVTEEDDLINVEIMQPNFNTVTADGALVGHKVTPQSDFYIENAKELLDNPGEFYFDKSTKILYYMPRSGEDMNTATVEGAVIERLVTINGSSKTRHIENITLRGIRFENSTFEKMYEYGLRTAQAQIVTCDKPIFIDAAIHIDYATGIEISDCEMTGLTKPAVHMNEGVIDSKIIGNRFYNIGDSAIVIDNQYHYTISGAREQCNRITISDNIINKSAQKHRGAPGISCYFAANVDIIHNKITNCNYTGISVGWGWNNYPNSTTCHNYTVANNYIENVNLIATDGGAIYTLGNQPGTVIEENYIVQNVLPEQNTGISGIYPDEGSSYITIRKNVIDMYAIRNYGGNVRDLHLWINTIKDTHAHDNYSTYTNVLNKGTNCVVDTPDIYVSGAEPEVVNKIIASSAIDIGL